MRKHLPNIFTSLNLFSGCIAAVMVFRNHPEWAAYLIFLSAFFDLLDGMIARIVNIHSPFGKELDSLADMVSFGFVPGAVLFKLLQHSEFTQWNLPLPIIQIGQFLPFIITIFSALRLAKFNLDKRQNDSFLGLPTPANTLLIVTLPLIILQTPGIIADTIASPAFILSVTMILSYLLVSEIPLFSLKFKSLGFKENFYQYSILLIAAIMIPTLGWIAFPILFVLYILLSVIKTTGIRTEKQR